jgi:hypothetical protein
MRWKVGDSGAGDVKEEGAEVEKHQGEGDLKEGDHVRVPRDKANS